MNLVPCQKQLDKSDIFTSFKNINFSFSNLKSEKKKKKSRFLYGMTIL